MGIELDYITRNKPAYQARCDECDTYLEMDAPTANVAQAQIRRLGWRRDDYIETAQHYTWLCPKCKDR